MFIFGYFWVKVLLLIFFTGNTILTFRNVGKSRYPITTEQATINAVVNAVWMALILLFIR